MFIGLMNYLFELSGHEDRPRYIAIMNVLTAPGAFGVAFIGFLLQHLSYPLVFGLVALGALTALTAALRMPVLKPGHVTTGDRPHIE